MASPTARVSALEPDPVLGQPLGNYVSDRLRLLVLGGAVVLIAGLLLNFTIGTIQEGWGPPLTVLLTAAVALGAGWGVLHGWNREIILYERGFTIGEGARVVPIRYDEVASVRLQAEQVSYFGLLRHNRYRFLLTTLHDEQIAITQWYRRAPELGARLTALVDAALRSQLEARWAQGEAVRFGDALALSAGGIESDGDTLDWADFGGYRIAQRRLTILDARGEPFASAPLAATDNLTLLLALLRERRAAERAGQGPRAI